MDDHPSELRLLGEFLRRVGARVLLATDGFLSCHTDPATKLQGFSVGGQDYVTKPFVEAEVLARVALHVDLARRLAGPDHALPRAGDAPPWLSDAVALFQAQLADTPKLTTLAHQVGTNPRRLNEAFRVHPSESISDRSLPGALRVA